MESGLSYVSSTSNQHRLYVMAVDGSGAKIQVSPLEALEQFWAKQGRKIYFLALKQGASYRLMEVDLGSSPSFSAGPPRELFEFGTARPSDVAPDGRFIRAGRDPSSSTLIVVTNWLKELNRLLPAN